jgi:hypothetical protein
MAAVSVDFIVGGGHLFVAVLVVCPVKDRLLVAVVPIIGHLVVLLLHLFCLYLN